MMRSATKKKLGKDKPYLDWLHTLECCIPGCASKHLQKWADQARSRTEAAHIGPRGLSTKVPDRNALPICGWHHELLHKVGPKHFWSPFNITPEELIAEYNRRFDAGERAE